MMSSMRDQNSYTNKKTKMSLMIRTVIVRKKLMKKFLLLKKEKKKEIQRNKECGSIIFHFAVEEKRNGHKEAQIDPDHKNIM